MPVFEYSGLTEGGKSVRGLKDAESRKALRSILRKDGIFLTDARSAEGAAAVASAAKVEAFSGQGLSREVDLRALFGSRVSAQDLAISTRQLATLIGAGITLPESLAALVEQVEHPRLKKVLGAVKQRVNEGASLADAFAGADLLQSLREHDPRRRIVGRARRGPHPARRLHRGASDAAQQAARGDALPRDHGAG